MTASPSRRGWVFAFSAVKRQQNLVSFTHSFSERPCRIGLGQPRLPIHIRNLSDIVRRVSSSASIESLVDLLKARYRRSGDSIESPADLPKARYRRSGDSIESPADLQKAQYKKLGRSGLRVSVPILGTIGFGDKRWAEWVEEEAKALPLLKAAFDRGINTWDTSNVYSNGESERIIGKAIQLFKIPRHKLVICTKCGGVTHENNDWDRTTIPSEGAASYVNHDGLSRQAIFNTVAASLARLETDYIDLLQIDHFDRSVPVEETMKALHDLVESGTVRYIGACSMYAHEFASMQFCAEKHGWTKFISMQNHYSLAYRQEEWEMLPFCYKTGVGIITWDYKASAQFMQPYPKQIPKRVSKYFPDYTRVDIKVNEKIQAVAKERRWPESYVVLAWLSCKGIHSPVISFNQIDKIDEALDGIERRLTEQEVRYLEKGYVHTVRGL